MSLMIVVFGVFLALKLMGVIGWSWWWVFSPLLGGCAFWFVVTVAALWRSWRMMRWR